MGMTQKQFAAELGVVYPTVNRWENGHITPSPIAIKLIEQKLNQMDESTLAQLSKYFQPE
jgi:DNA-binding transcriptional regulator YiaG